MLAGSTAPWWPKLSVVGERGSERGQRHAANRRAPALHLFAGMRSTGELDWIGGCVPELRALVEIYQMAWVVRRRAWVGGWWMALDVDPTRIPAGPTSQPW
jgi:hypothetical protein